jgi:hypothetical protein
MGTYVPYIFPFKRFLFLINFKEFKICEIGPKGGIKGFNRLISSTVMVHTSSVVGKTRWRTAFFFPLAKVNNSHTAHQEKRNKLLAKNKKGTCH